MMSKEQLVELAALVADKMQEKKSNRSGVGIRTGAAVGSGAAVVCHAANQVPVVGHTLRFVGDFCEGARVGYALQMEQIEERAARREEERAQAQAIAAAKAKKLTQADWAV